MLACKTVIRAVIFGQIHLYANEVHDIDDVGRPLSAFCPAVAGEPGKSVRKRIIKAGRMVTLVEYA